MKNSKTVIVATFLISLIFFSVGTQYSSGALSETREFALIKRISLLQINDLGAFRKYQYIPGKYYLLELRYVNAPLTAEALMSLKILNALDYINFDDAINYVITKQHPIDGGYGVHYGHDGTPLGLDLSSTYSVVQSLKFLNELDRLNCTALVCFVLTRYNTSLGAFHEPITKAYNKSYAFCNFVMSFTHPDYEMAYAIPNIISTFLGVSILADLNALDRIDVTKTVEWITQCKTSDGLFEPFPNATYTPLPPWSPLRTNPFNTDRKGTAVPYIYAAIGALSALDSLNILSPKEKENIQDYLVQCQSYYGKFYKHSEEQFSDHSAWTEYAIMSLYKLDMLSEAKENVQKTVDYIIENQILDLDNSLLLPQPSSEAYGLFWLGGTDSLGDALTAIRVLNATNNLNLLHVPTLKLLLTLRNALLLSLIAPSILAIVLTWRWIVKKRSEQPLSL